MKLLNTEIMSELLYAEKRSVLLDRIISNIKKIAERHEIEYMEIPLGSSGLFIPVLYREKSDPNSTFLLLLGAQHNEYNGTFGILEFLNSKMNKSLFEWQKSCSGGFLIIPVLNIRGFLHPIFENKWGYYVTGINNLQQTNCNRFWDKTLEQDIFQKYESSIPEESRVVGDFLLRLRQDPRTPLTVLDFHETSLPYRIRKEMTQTLNLNYLSDLNWIKEVTLESAFKYKGISYLNKKRSEDIKWIKEAVTEMSEHIQEKAIYFLFYSPYSKDLANFLDSHLQKEFASVLWYSSRYIVDHSQKIEGCFVSANMSRPWMCAIEIESHKLFFNLPEEQKKYEENLQYGKYLLNQLRLNSNIAANVIYFTLKYLSSRNNKEK